MTALHTFTLVVAVLVVEPLEASLLGSGTSGMVEFGTVMHVVGAVTSAMVAATHPQWALVSYTAEAAILAVGITYHSGVTGVPVTEQL